LKEERRHCREHANTHNRMRGDDKLAEKRWKNRPHSRGVGSIRTCDRTRSILPLFFENNNYNRRLRFWTDSIFAKMATIHKRWTSGRWRILHCRNIHKKHTNCARDTIMLIFVGHQRAQ